MWMPLPAVHPWSDTQPEATFRDVPHLNQVVTCIVDGLKSLLGLDVGFGGEGLGQDPQQRHEGWRQDLCSQSPEGGVGVVKDRLGCLDQRDVCAALLCVEVNPVPTMTEGFKRVSPLMTAPI